MPRQAQVGLAPWLLKPPRLPRGSHFLSWTSLSLEGLMYTLSSPGISHTPKVTGPPKEGCEMLTPPRLPPHLSFKDGSWRLVRTLRKFPTVQVGAQRWAGETQAPTPLYSYCTDGETKAQEDPVTQLAWAAFSPASHPETHAWIHMPTLPPPPAVQPQFPLMSDGDDHSILAHSGMGTHMENTDGRGPCSPSSSSQVAAKLPDQLLNPKPIHHNTHCPEKAGNCARVTQQGPSTLRLKLGPCSAKPPAPSLPLPKWIWRSQGGARAWQQPGEGERQAGSWGWWEEPFFPLSLANPDPRFQAALQSPHLLRHCTQSAHSGRKERLLPCGMGLQGCWREGGKPGRGSGVRTP